MTLSVESEPPRDFQRLLRDDGVIQSDYAGLTPLAGGVSSDIYKVEDGDRVFVVKRALEKLRVADEWRADLSRNRYEVAYLEVVGRFLPHAVPKVLEHRPEHGYFAMEYLGDGFENWKTLMLGGNCGIGHARQAGEVLGTIHRETWRKEKLKARFDSTQNFHELRLEPYLLTTAKRHPDWRRQIEAEAARVRETRLCLVHGDFSPKNILFRGERLVLLDCEVAWFGDPAFDVAFLLNHLMLKALHLEAQRENCLRMVLAAWESYEQTLGVGRVSEAVPRLLAMLMLARVDGKSPVEYLDADEQETVRGFVFATLAEPVETLEELVTRWRNYLENY